MGYGPVPRRTVIGSALIAAAGLFQVRAASAAGAAEAAPDASASGEAVAVTSEDIRDLLDRNAIVEMVSRLGKWLDTHGFDDDAASEALFAPGITVETPGGKAEGIAAVRSKARARHGNVRTQHLHTNVLVDLHGDTATAEANLLVTFVPDPEKPDTFSQVGTRYHFDLVRAGGGWKFARIHDRMIWRRAELPPEGNG